MISHVVMWKVRDNIDGKTKVQLVQEFKERLEALPELIPEINAFEVGVNISERETAGDLVLLSEFDSQEDLEIYAKHPEHLKVVDFVKTIAEESRVVDYEVEG